MIRPHSTPNPLVLAGLMPHPPIVVPAVGRGREQESAQTVEAMTTLARRFVAANPAVLVVISPHSPRKPGSFGIWGGDRVRGDLGAFGAPGAAVNFPVDSDFVQRLRSEAKTRGLRTWNIDDPWLDHGAVVPLTYLADAGWSGPTIIIGLNYPGEGGLEAMGRAIDATSQEAGGPVAVLASGDMSHRLQPSAPGGYHPRAHEFDEAFTDAVANADFEALKAIDPELISLAGEDVLDSTLVALAAIDFDPKGTRLMSYEGPFGVGYSVAVLYDGIGEASKAHDEEIQREELPAIARRAVVRYLDDRGRISTTAPLEPFMLQSSGVFVTIRDPDGGLRGCIGSLAGQFPNLFDETVDRAIAAAVRDPRFAPVSANEVDGLSFEVSVLHPSEPVESEGELDPERYGVIIEDHAGRRAVMLPGIETLDTVERQLSATRQKAGIRPDAEISIERFQVDKFRET